MRVIAIINLKGGVGKTTTAVNMAAILGAAGKRVLVIDADPQANATQYLLGEGSADVNSIADVMSGDAADPYDYLYETGLDGVDVLPASIDLIEADFASVEKGGNIGSIKAFLDCVEDDAKAGIENGYDYVIIDCPPSFTAASVAALYAADDVIIPVKVDAFSVNGMVQLISQIGSIRRFQPKIRIAGVLLTMWHNAPAVVQGEEILRSSAVPVFRTVIRRSDKVDEAGFLRQSLDEYSRNSAAGKDYRRFVTEFLEVQYGEI